MYPVPRSALGRRSGWRVLAQRLEGAVPRCKADRWSRCTGSRGGTDPVGLDMPSLVGLCIRSDQFGPPRLGGRLSGTVPGQRATDVSMRDRGACDRVCAVSPASSSTFYHGLLVFLVPCAAWRQLYRL